MGKWEMRGGEAFFVVGQWILAVSLFNGFMFCIVLFVCCIVLEFFA
jgi:hypothetical protein